MTISVFSAAISATLLATAPVFAADLADGSAISAAIFGNTVQGSMVSSGVYTEFYAEDGEIRGDGYQGAWSVRDDTMCFDYGEYPEACWQVRVYGDQVTWVQDGQDLGAGTIIKGNVNAF